MHGLVNAYRCDLSCNISSRYFRTQKKKKIPILGEIKLWILIFSHIFFFSDHGSQFTFVFETVNKYQSRSSWLLSEAIPNLLFRVRFLLNNIIFYDGLFTDGRLAVGSFYPWVSPPYLSPPSPLLLLCQSTLSKSLNLTTQEWVM